MSARKAQGGAHLKATLKQVSGWLCRLSDGLAVPPVRLIVLPVGSTSHFLYALRRKHRLQRTVIAQAKFAEGVQVLRLHGGKRLGGKNMIEAVLEAVPVTPAPSILPRLLGMAM